MEGVLAKYDPRRPVELVAARLGLERHDDGWRDPDGRRVVQEEDPARGPGWGVFRAAAEEPVNLDALESFWVGRKGRQVHPAVEATLRARVEAGESDEAIAAELGCGPALVKELRLVARVLRGASHAPPVSDDRIRELHAGGASSVDIAEATGLAMSTVYTRLSELGLKSNRPRRARYCALPLTPDERERLAYAADAAGFLSIEDWLRHLTGLDQ